ncbi:MAG: isochorismatase family protein [Candidatus Limnocylindria bacterium]
MRLPRSDAPVGSPTRPPTHPPTEPSRDALVVVDVQNDFVDPRGSLAVRGAARLLPRVNREISRAASTGSLVVCTQDWHPPSTPHFARDGGRWPVHCVAETWGAQLHPELRVSAYVPRIRKGVNGEDGYSAFSVRDPLTGAEGATELEDLLRASAVTRVVICGVATDYCVRATALDAMRLGFETAVLTDAVAAVNLRPGDGERALDEMAAAGVELRPDG